MKRLTWKRSLDGYTDVGLRGGVTVGEAICKLADYEETEAEASADAVEAVLCGKCKFSNISISVTCAYLCRNKKSPCYKRVSYADFGCLYGERKEEK